MTRYALPAALLAAVLSACSTVEPARPVAEPTPPPPVPAPITPVPDPAASQGPVTTAPLPGQQRVPPMKVRTLHDVQQRLHDLGYDPGPVDGMAGPKTRAALGAFQKDRGLRPTGRMDSPTREALSAGR